MLVIVRTSCRRRFSSNQTGRIVLEGSEVFEHRCKGRYNEIVDYCVSDAVQTAFVFLRWRLVLQGIARPVNGAASTALDRYRRAARSLLDA